jgi:hypothetical protein
VDKYYPAIFYPRLIIKFMVDNPTHNFREYSDKADRKQVNLSEKEKKYRDYAFNKIFYMIICIALIISIYLHIFGLYPLLL